MIYDIGTTDFEKAYIFQRELLQKRASGEIDDAVILTEHTNVFTLGRAGDPANLLVDPVYLNKSGIKFIRTDRGGDITYHGHGQLVAYPIFDLRSRSKDLHKYLRKLEEVIIDFLREYQIDAVTINGKTGVWTAGGKIAFIGISARDWITYHGLSININTDLNYYSMIRPCGLSGIDITSVRNIVGSTIDMQLAKMRFIRSIEKVLNVRSLPSDSTMPAVA